jgi:hypothetical protein
MGDKKMYGESFLVLSSYHIVASSLPARLERPLPDVPFLGQLIEILRRELS